MRRAIGLLVMSMFLWPARADEENPWIAKLPPAVAEAKRDGTPPAYLKALDAAWRADRWEAGLDLAQAANEKFPDNPQLRSSICRALWRAGRMLEAERIAERLSPLGDDRVALHMLILIHHSRGEIDKARQASKQLRGLNDLTAADLSYILMAPVGQRGHGDALEIVRKMEELIDPSNGYPEVLLNEATEGLAAFLERPNQPFVRRPRCR